MKNYFKFIIISILFSWNSIYSQGSDIIICLDNSGSIGSTAFNQMTVSTRSIIESVLRCNTNNRVAVVHYGTMLENATPSLSDTPKIYIESDFTNNIIAAQNFSRRLGNGDHFHEATGLIGNALDNITNTNIVSTQKTLNTTPSRPLIIFLFTDASRTGGDLSSGSFLVNYFSQNPIGGNNSAFSNFTNFKNNRNAKFVVVHVANNPVDKAAAAAISSLGGSYTGPDLETYPADPDNGQFPRSYLNKTNFTLTGAEVLSVTNNICTISKGNLEFSLESVSCQRITYPFNIDGTYTIPPATSITNFQIALVNTITGISYPVSTTVTYPSANHFNFVINQADFTNPLLGEYNFVISMTYSNGSTSQTISASNAVIGLPYDIQFCCPTDLYITTDVASSNVDAQSASNSITANNIVESGANAVYHAGNFVLLQTAFHAKAGSNLHAYIEGCSGITNLQKGITYIADDDPNHMKSLLNENSYQKQKAISVSPNPNNGLAKVVLNKTNSGILQILDINGKTVFQRSFINEKEINFNIQSLPSSTYIIKVILGNEILTEKIIKK